MKSPDDTLRVAERWGDRDFKAGLATSHWMASETVRVYLNWLATGMGDRDWLSYLMSRWVPQEPSRVLVLGCGDGWLERSIAPFPWISRIDAYDVAADAVATAAETARLQGIDKIRYGVKNLNEEGFGDERFDVVIAHSVLHHVENLEALFSELHGALLPEGVLLVNEYVGPKRFQFTDQQLALENAILSLLPERFRRGHLRPGVWDEKPRPTVEEMIRTDPSEAVRSDEIVALLEQRFEVLESREYGGTILHDLLYDLVPNFSHEDAAERSLIVALCLAEAALIRRAVLPSDFVVMALAPSRRKALAPAPDSWVFATEGSVPWSPAGGSSWISSWKPARSVLDRPWLNLASGRRAENLLATGTPGRDWIEDAVAIAEMPERVGVGGDDVSSVSQRLERLGVEVREQGPFDLLVGSRLFVGGVRNVRSRLAGGGLAVSFEGFDSATDLPLWSDEFARTLVGLLPEEWKEDSSATQMVREGFVRRDGTLALPSLLRKLDSAGLAGTIRPLSSPWISRLLSATPLHRITDDECAATLLSLLVWIDGMFASHGLLPVGRALVVARNAAR